MLFIIITVKSHNYESQNNVCLESTTVKSRFNVQTQIKEQNFVTKMEFHFKKSRSKE